MMDSQDHDNLPDLPALESVRVANDSTLAMLGMGVTFAGGFGGVALWMLIRYSGYFETLGLSLAVITVALCTWCLAALLLTPFRLGADASGLTLRSVLFRRVVPWTDVKQADSRIAWTGHVVYTLHTSRGGVSLDRPYFGGVSYKDCLLASIWQHLRRVGRVDEFELPDGALSLWREIDDDVPHEAHWGKPPSRPAKLGVALGIAMFPALVVAMLVSTWPAVPAMLLLACAMAPFLIVMHCIGLPQELRAVREITVGDTGLDACLIFARVRIAWTEVTDARWDSHAFVIRAENPPREVRLPRLLRHSVSDDVLLATVRSIRSAVPNLAIPFSTTAAAEQVRSSPEWKEYSRLQNTMLACIMSGLMLGLMAVALNLPGLLSRLIHAGPGTRFFFPASAWPLVLPFMVGGLALGAVVGRRIVERRARPDSPLWLKFVHVGSWTCSGSMRRMMSAAGIAGLLALPLTVNCYLKVTDSGVRVNRYWSLCEQTFPWRAVRSVEVLTIATRQSGSQGATHTCVVRFDDGSSWRFSDENRGEFLRNDVLKAAEFIARKSGLSVDYR